VSINFAEALDVELLRKMSGVPVTRAYASEDAFGVFVFKCEDNVVLRVDVSSCRAHEAPERIVASLRRAYDNATCVQRYLARPRPRLGAGTVGYTRRRR
jgi:hypothetical protein